MILQRLKNNVAPKPILQITFLTGMNIFYTFKRAIFEKIIKFGVEQATRASILLVIFFYETVAK